MAEFERERIVERTKEGIEAAHQRGKALGRGRKVKPALPLRARPLVSVDWNLASFSGNMLLCGLFDWETDVTRRFIHALLVGCFGLLVSIDNSRWTSEGNILAVYVTVENTGSDYVKRASVWCYALKGDTPISEGAGMVRELAAHSKQRETIYIARPTGADSIECTASKLW